MFVIYYYLLHYCETAKDFNDRNLFFYNNIRIAGVAKQSTAIYRYVDHEWFQCRFLARYLIKSKIIPIIITNIYKL